MNLNPPNHIEARRLAFIKFLYTTAVEQSHATELTAGASLLTFHDAVEGFLLIAAERNGIKDQPQFAKYWDEFDTLLAPATLPQRQSLSRLSKARVGIKHHGNLPALSDIEAHRAAVTLFFQDATVLLFSTEFSNISMVEYVYPEESRNLLHEAQGHIRSNDLSKASENIVYSFELMLSSHVDMISNDAFSFNEDMSFMSAFFIFGLDAPNRKLGEFIDKTSRSVNSLQKAVRILSLGLDYKKYSKFSSLLPALFWSMTKTPIMHQTADREKELTAEYLEFCINFVIECSIKLKS